MSYKPTHEELVAYLYDEIEPTLKAQIEAYLKNNPKAKEELEALESTRLIFSDLEDEALPDNIPLLIPQGNSEWLYWRKYVAIAATLLLLITFGWLSGFNMQSNKNGFQVAFGEIQNGLTEQQVADLINQDRQLMFDYMSNRLKSVEDSLGYEMQTLQANYNSQEVVRNIFNQEKEVLLQQMTSLNDRLTGNYRDVLKEIVVSFSNNWDNQRIEDLRNIQAAFTNLEDAAINKQMDLEEAFIALSERVQAIAANNPNKK
ncbi:MAG: hypothetical protein ACJAXB_000711 [Candidatus Endobugula sp.]|jgi:hypothetical protein